MRPTKKFTLKKFSQKFHNIGSSRDPNLGKKYDNLSSQKKKLTPYYKLHAKKGVSPVQLTLNKFFFSIEYKPFVFQHF